LHFPIFPSNDQAGNFSGFPRMGRPVHSYTGFEWVRGSHAGCCSRARQIKL